jgi:hypothetical protein
MMKAAEWWTYFHMGCHFTQGPLKITHRQNGYSCRLFASNAIAHHANPERYALMDQADVDDERLKVMLKVITHHTSRMVSSQSGVHIKSSHQKLQTTFLYRKDSHNFTFKHPAKSKQALMKPDQESDSDLEIVSLLSHTHLAPPKFPEHENVDHSHMHLHTCSDAMSLDSSFHPSDDDDNGSTLPSPTPFHREGLSLMSNSSWAENSSHPPSTHSSGSLT